MWESAERKKEIYFKAITGKCKKETKLFYSFFDSKLKQKGINNLKIIGKVYGNAKTQVDIMNKFLISLCRKKTLFYGGGSDQKCRAERHNSGVQEVHRLLEAQDERKASGRILRREEKNYEHCQKGKYCGSGGVTEQGISQTSMGTKMWEKSLKDRWMKYISRGGYFDCQFGFRIKWSCDNNLLSYCSRVKKKVSLLEWTRSFRRDRQMRTVIKDRMALKENNKGWRP